LRADEMIRRRDIPYLILLTALLLLMVYGLGLGVARLIMADLSPIGLVGWRKTALVFVLVVLGPLPAVWASILITDSVFSIYEKLRKWKR